MYMLGSLAGSLFITWVVYNIMKRGINKAVGTLIVSIAIVTTIVLISGAIDSLILYIPSLLLWFGLDVRKNKKNTYKQV